MNNSEFIGDVKRSWIQRIANATGEAQVVFQYQVSLQNKTLYAGKEYFDRWIKGKFAVDILATVHPRDVEKPDVIIFTETLPILDKQGRP